MARSRTVTFGAMLAAYRTVGDNEHHFVHQFTRSTGTTLNCRHRFTVLTAFGSASLDDHLIASPVPDESTVFQPMGYLCENGMDVVALLGTNYSPVFPQFNSTIARASTVTTSLRRQSTSRTIQALGALSNKDAVPSLVFVCKVNSKHPPGACRPHSHGRGPRAGRRTA
jgi:hypothetical protein